ncbi:hypothetical protein ACTTAL_19255 (plasmid) [Rhodobacter capsulatus]|uniref:hypothetical protein n=1 Tax=Rhodobacter capsulatus TaxID=1061 RepID=UPI0018E2D69E
MVERVIRTLKAQCIHRHRFESTQHANRVIGDWIVRPLSRTHGDRGLTQQPPPPSSGPCHAHACRGIQISGLT